MAFRNFGKSQNSFNFRDLLNLAKSPSGFWFFRISRERGSDWGCEPVEGSGIPPRKFPKSQDFLTKL
jgi:hypothetical protein